jgi:hypothetical protein
LLRVIIASLGSIRVPSADPQGARGEQPPADALSRSSSRVVSAGQARQVKAMRSGSNRFRTPVAGPTSIRSRTAAMTAR